MRRKFSTEYTMISCAVKQVYGLGEAYTAEEKKDKGLSFLDTIVDSIPRVGNRAFIFSDVDMPHRGGPTIAEYLITNQLGEVSASAQYKNGNYGGAGSPLRVWTFIPNCEAILEHLKNERSIIEKVKDAVTPKRAEVA